MKCIKMVPAGILLFSTCLTACIGFSGCTKNTPEPILLSDIQQKMDWRGLMADAKEGGMEVAERSERKGMLGVRR